MPNDLFLCVGTTPTVQRVMTFDRIELDQVNRAREVVEHASGKSVNVARVLATIGKRSLAVGIAGGRRGETLLEGMAHDGIANDFVRTRSQTRLCTTLIERSTGLVTELVEEAPAPSTEEWEQVFSCIEKHIAHAKMVIFSGTLAPGAPDDFCSRFIGRGPMVIVDAKGKPMKLALEADGPVIGKLNRQELAQTLGRPIATDSELFDAMRQAMPKRGWLVVTMGKDGAVALVDGQFYRVGILKVQVASPIGSGDSFAAGLAAGLDRGPVEALRLAGACAVANVLTPRSGYVRPADVEAFLPRIPVEKIG